MATMFQKAKVTITADQMEKIRASMRTRLEREICEALTEPDGFAPDPCATLVYDAFSDAGIALGENEACDDMCEDRHQAAVVLTRQEGVRLERAQERALHDGVKGLLKAGTFNPLADKILDAALRNLAIEVEPPPAKRAA